MERERMTVEITTACSSHSIADREQPKLVIDYGGHELAFEATELGEASEFAIGLAYAALCFSSQCRFLMNRSS